MRRPLLPLLALVALLVPSVAGNATGATTAAAATARSGYWMLDSAGQVYAFGDALHHGDQAAVLRASPSFHGSMVKRHESVDLEPSPAGSGYWILSNAGVVDAFGDARGRVFIDRMPSLGGGEDATSISATPSGNGLWLFTSKGRVVTYGDAPYLGDMSGAVLNGPVLDSIPTATGKGYYMVAADGGIFAFGDDKFYGSMGSTRLNAPVQSLVPDGDGAGYWLVASDGGIFAFEAPFKGSMGATPLSKPVTGMVRFGDGYLMVGEDGGIFNFSNRPFAGSLGDRPPARPIVSVAAFERLLADVALGPAPSEQVTDTSTSTTTVTTGPAPENEEPSTTTTTTTVESTTTTTVPPAERPTCFGYEPDEMGTEGDDTLGPKDTNNDGKYVTMGLGGNDTFSHRGLDSGSPTEVYFCGGPGDDEGHGWLQGFDGGEGTDTAYQYDCTLGGVPARLESVEQVHAAHYQCGQIP